MAGNFLNIDIAFPTFTGRESDKERTATMLNYLRQLVDQLKYTLNNLEEKNFNKTALDGIMEDGTADVREAAEQLTAQLQQTNENLSSVSARVTSLEGLPSRMTTAERNITQLQQTVNEHGQTLTEHTASIGSLSQALTALLSVISVDSSGNVTIGGTGVRVDVNGSVYINGQAQ